MLTQEKHKTSGVGRNQQWALMKGLLEGETSVKKANMCSGFSSESRLSLMHHKGVEEIRRRNKA